MSGFVKRRLILNADLSFSSRHQIFELYNLVVDGGSVAFLDGVVSGAFLALVRLEAGFPTDGDTVDGKLFCVHHQRNCGQDGAAAHQCLTTQHTDRKNTVKM